MPGSHRAAGGGELETVGCEDCRWLLRLKPHRYSEQASVDGDVNFSASLGMWWFGERPGARQSPVPGWRDQGVWVVSMFFRPWDAE